MPLASKRQLSGPGTFFRFSLRADFVQLKNKGIEHPVRSAIYIFNLSDKGKSIYYLAGWY